MALSAGYKQDNVDGTILKRIYETFDTGSYAGKVVYPDALADPSAMDARSTSLKNWVEVQILQRGVGTKLPTILQVDGYWIAGDAANQATADQFGNKLTVMMDAFLSAFGAPATVGFVVYDFTLSQSSPALTLEWLLIRNSRGQQGWPDERTPVQIDRGMWRQTLTYHVWHEQDLSSAQAHF